MADPAANATAAAKQHYAWNASTSTRAAELARLGVSTAPLKVSAASAEPAPGPTSPHASAWNSAGTWEEKKVTASAVAALRARLLAARFPPRSGVALRLKAVPKLQGEVTVVSVRGKVRCGYELQLEAEWELQGEGAGGGGGAAAASGTLQCALEDTDSDVFESLEVRVAAHPALAKGEAVSMVKLADDALRDAVRAWAKATAAGPPA